MKKSILSLIVVLTLICSTTFSFAAADPYVTIVNPVNNSTTAASNILISVKVTRPKTIRVSLLEQKELLSNNTYASIDLNRVAQGTVPKKENIRVVKSGMQPKTFKTYNNLTFCTKQVNGLNPGLYKVRVETLNSAGRAIYTRESDFGIKAKTSAGTQIFENQQSGTFQFLQNILKSIFGS